MSKTSIVSCPPGTYTEKGEDGRGEKGRARAAAAAALAAKENVDFCMTTPRMGDDAKVQ
jgi:hypothetical protein